MILHLDSDEEYRRSLGGLLEMNGHKVCSAASLGEALEAVSRHPVKVVLTEIELPDVTTEQIIDALHRQNPSAALIVLTSRPERRAGNDRRLGRVFEFLEKSEAPHALLSHLDRAKEFHRQHAESTASEGESEAKLRSKLEWLIWKQQTKLRVVDNYATLVNNVKHSVSQGAGLDVICTLIDLLAAGVQEKDGQTVIQPEVLPALLQASSSARKWLEGVDRMLEIVHRLRVRARGAASIPAIIEKAVRDVEKLRGQKEQTIHLGRLLDCSAALPADSLEICVRELLTNAFKFSPEGSLIEVATHRTGNAVSISVMNDVMTMDGSVDGIPEGMEETIFEPLVRLNNSYDERFREEELGMGFGLAVVQNLVSAAGGRVYAREIRDYSKDFLPRRRILAEMVLPLAETHPPRS